MNKPFDESDNGVNFWFGNGDGVLTFSQDTRLEAGDYTLTAEAMGEGADFYVSAADQDGEKGSDQLLLKVTGGRFHCQLSAPQALFLFRQGGKACATGLTPKLEFLFPENSSQKGENEI